jgi:butyryl-CoA dehydrogenase
MFHMMNEARVGVGGGAAALGYTGYLHALDYARTRTQGRLATAKAGPPVPIIDHPDVARMLLAQKAYAEGGVALILYCARLLDEERTAPEPADRARAHLLLDTLTPIAKSWPSQWCQEGTSLAIQVLGGAGYTRDYDVEQHWRDQRLNPIHEGTHGIQALDLLGRKVLAGPGLSVLESRISETVRRAEAAGGEAAALGASLASWVARLGEVTVDLAGLGDPAKVTANATVYLEAAGHLVIAWLWLEQFLAASGDGEFYEGKRQAARYFFRWELPKIGPMLDLLASGDTTTLEMRAEWF